MSGRKRHYLAYQGDMVTGMVAGLCRAVNQEEEVETLGPARVKGWRLAALEETGQQRQEEVEGVLYWLSEEQLAAVRGWWEEHGMGGKVKEVAVTASLLATPSVERNDCVLLVHQKEEEENREERMVWVIRRALGQMVYGAKKAGLSETYTKYLHNLSTNTSGAAAAPPPPASTLVFVYGTLLHGLSNHYLLSEGTDVEFVGKGESLDLFKMMDAGTYVVEQFPTHPPSHPPISMQVDSPLSPPRMEATRPSRGKCTE